ncbi:MAG TPA: helix-turn-helix domain-containing protein [Bryobacteraceae bacterium]|nr:helix-turn-helix domain-containing protein [Bryobacteraceae bacterium]
MTANQESTSKDPRDLRLRNQYFPDAAGLVFETSKKGFVPLPIIMRKLMRKLTPPELRVLIYLQTRCSKYFICYPTLEEMAHDLGLGGRRNLTPHIKALEKKKFITTASGGGKTFFLVHDPRVAIVHMVETEKMNENDLYELNELLRDLKQEEITATAKPKAAPVPIRKAKSA